MSEQTEYNLARYWWDNRDVLQKRILMKKYFPDCEWTFRLTIPQIISIYKSENNAKIIGDFEVK